MKGDRMRQDYANNQASLHLLVGFDFHGLYYYAEATLGDFLIMAKYDKTSKSHGKKACLRFKPTAEQKKAMIEGGRIGKYHCRKAVFLCTATEFKDKQIGRENKGQTFERLIKEMYYGEPCENRFWWNGADFRVSWHTYQVKFENGTLCTAEQCRKVRE